MGKFISVIVGIVVLIIVVMKVIGLFSGGMHKSESKAFYFGELAEKIDFEDFEHATGTDGGEDVFYQFTASDETIEKLLTKLEFTREDEGISRKIVMKSLYTLPDWFAPSISEDRINILYGEYYGMILVKSKRTIEDPENDDQTIEVPVYYFGAAGKHLKKE